MKHFLCIEDVPNAEEVDIFYMNDMHDSLGKDIENISPQDFELDISPKDFELEEEFQEYLRTRYENSISVLSSLSLLGLSVVEYERVRFGNIKAGRELCKRCGGTGDEGFFMRRKCTECEGRGY